MSAIGGSIQSVILRGRTFAVAADSDSTRKLGGSENANQPNGNGSSRIIKSVMLWSLTGLAVEIDDSRGDLEFLQDLADLNDHFDVGVTYASGAVYVGLGQLEGEFPASSQSATAAIGLSGPGKLRRQ